MSKKQNKSLLAKYLNLYKSKPNSRVFAPLAESYRKLGMVNEAMEVIEKGLRHHPSYVLGYLVLAKCYYDLKKYELCYSTIRPFVSTSLDNISIQNLYADVCLKLGHLQEAFQAYKYLVFLNPRDPIIYKRLKALEDDLEVEERVNNGEPAPYRASNFDSDEEDWTQVDLTSNNNEEELSYSENPRLVSKIQEIGENIGVTVSSSGEEGDGDDDSAPIVTHTLVDIYIKQGHLEKAQEVLQRIIDINPRDTKSAQKLAEVEQLMDNPQNTEADGHEKLLNLIDSKIKRKNPSYQEIAEKFQSFLDALRSKASTV